MTLDCDLFVVGAGPGGYAAALDAAKRGLSVTLAEKALVGGTCLNWGCIPTKLFLGATEAMTHMSAQTRLRLASGDFTLDLPALQTRKQRMLAATRKGMLKTLEQAGVTLVEGSAGFTGPSTAQVRGETHTLDIAFKKAIVAAGSGIGQIPGLEADGQTVLNSDHALSIEQAPESIAVIGAGAVGLELAQFFHRLGAKITIIEAMDRLAPTEDPDVSAELAKIYKRAGWNLNIETRVASIDTQGGKAVLSFDPQGEIQAEKVLLAVGRIPNTTGLEFEAAGAELKPNKAVEVDKNLRAAENIFAVGDVNGLAMLAHAAEDQALYAVRFITGETDNPYEPGAIPYCIYGSPEVMRVGKTEDELRRDGLDPSVTRAPLASNPIAQAHGHTQGFVKVAWTRDRVAGITAVGDGVARLTTTASVMVAQGWTVKEAEKLVFPHPTLDESLKEALLAHK